MKPIDKLLTRHCILDTENLTARVTSKVPENEFDITLHKVPKHEIKCTWREKICEGGSWYSEGEMLSKTDEFDNQYLVIKDGECIGLVEDVKTKSGKVQIKKLDGFKKAMETLKEL